MSRVTFTEEQLKNSKVGKNNPPVPVKTIKKEPTAYLEPTNWDLVNLCNGYTFELTPVPAVRVTQRLMKIIHIPDSQLDAKGISKKKAILAYEKFKDDLRFLARQQNFVLPDSHWHVTFYLPMPAGWSETKRKEFDMLPHKQVPDTDNLLKAFKDALSSNDRSIWDERASKYWCYGHKSRIEIQLNKP